MEIVLEKSVVLNRSVKEETEDDSCNNQDRVTAESDKQVGSLLTLESSSMEKSLDQDTSPILKSQEEELESAKANMGIVREENERLKLLLSKIVKDYKELQTHFYDIIGQEDQTLLEKLPELQTARHGINDGCGGDLLNISLSLGRDSSSTEQKKEITRFGNKGKCNGMDMKGEGLLQLGLGLESVASEENSFEESNKRDDDHKEMTREIQPRGSGSKNVRSDERQGEEEEEEEEEVLQQPQLKKTRVSIRARCDTPTMNDGCQWRKYGQKIAKGNPCPRAYYRCTGSPTCPVRKQVQRCADDTTILITTYEGSHNHPLQSSATAMASATSAAASMATSSSSSSSFSSSASQYFPPHTSSFSTSNSHPTITLDLTAPNNHHRQLLNHPSPPPPPSTASLSFSSFQTNAGGRQLNFGAVPNGHNRSLWAHADYSGFGGLMNRQLAPQQSINTDAIAAVITSNPGFRSALAAAFTNYVGQDHHHGPARNLFYQNNTTSTTTTTTQSPLFSSASARAFGSNNAANANHPNNRK